LNIEDVLPMSSTNKELKLTIELVPETSWCNNVRNTVSKSVWDNIRKKAYSEYHNKCGICSASGQMSCHEIWDYDDTTHTQRLRGFIALCNSCHMIKHFGMAGILAEEGKLDLNKLIRHFIIVNNCDSKEFEKHKNQAFDTWRKRSQYEWTINFGEYDKLISKKNIDNINGR
jgi:hypothetical protein